MNNKDKCECGHPVNHPLVIKHKEHSWLGKCLQLIGISSIPIKIQYECIKCGMTFGDVTQPEELKKHL